tara:strand:+ start:6788 stop:9661 length:2874 start_codon:yes stop_codon:yes gene_type:complete
MNDFVKRHVGLGPEEINHVLATLNKKDLFGFVADVIPNEILDRNLVEESLSGSTSETEALCKLKDYAIQNHIKRSLIGLGYHGTTTPSVVQRHVFENPAWYTAYTPYQAEISQGRLEALFNFQTLITELTGLPIANASLLDEASAAAEAMNLAFSACKRPNGIRFLVDNDSLPQTIAVLKTRAEPLGISIELSAPNDFHVDDEVFGVFLQLPGKSGRVWDPSSIIKSLKEDDLAVIAAVDPLAQVLMLPIGDFGIDIAVGSMQRFGVPMGFGGPHAAFFATRETFKRQIPGRLVGQSLDQEGNPALRLALQTREQHIRRDKATSNICTAQVLLAVISSFYAVHHGSDGLYEIAKRVFYFTKELEKFILEIGYEVDSIERFDTIEVNCENAGLVHELALKEGFNLRILPEYTSLENAKGFGITLDELTTEEELLKIYKFLAYSKGIDISYLEKIDLKFDKTFKNIPTRNKPWLKQSVFMKYRSETDLLRYIHRLVSRDFSLVNGMIPLGSCTMKLNAASELAPVSWKEFSDIHPFAPPEQTNGFTQIISDLENWLAELTGFYGVSLQPNAGSQGEFAGLLVIRAWHKSREEQHRNVCLIPTSAHGTNPASAVMAGFKVIPVACDDFGNIDLNDLKNKATINADKLAALMVTYPSTHGVFEPNIKDICQIIHSYGGQVYLDGANLNAQVGLCRPGAYGADVCHLNLHKTFCIPHGGGGPGVGPIAVAAHLCPFLPSHPYDNEEKKLAIGAISAAPFGSAGILPISWMYLKMMGAKGLRHASMTAILAANYIAYRLSPYYPVLYKGEKGFVAHECILDLRQIKKASGVEVDDIAKRLMDYGFHAPTVSWPVAGTMMVEPTESESLDELDRFCEAMIAIRNEISSIELGQIDSVNNPLKCAPHTISAIISKDWDRPYSREEAVFPLPNQRENKFWPYVARIDNAYGDRNLICSCSVFFDEE